MPTYLISPPEDTGWQEDPAAFAAALGEHWPDAHTRVRADGPHTLVDFDLDGTLGSLLTKADCVTISVSLETAAAVAAWWRRRVPADIPLLLYDEGFDADVPVAPGATAEALVAAYVAAT